jgi:hypothetical protein
MMWMWTLAILGMALAPITPSSARAAGNAAATLSVLAAPVERLPEGGTTPEPGVDGMDLAEGDRIRTGPDGLALITFLNGTTVTVMPQTEVTVKQSGQGRGHGGMRMLIHAGRVWARVVETVGRGSSLSLESNEYTATARDGLIGAERAGDGFVCWSRRGEVHLIDRSGLTNVVVTAGRRARAHSGLTVSADPFLASASAIEVRTSGPVVPLVRMPDGRRAAGFLAPDVEVNQVFGSLTERGAADRWLIEVPGGHPGPYTLVLTGTGTGSFTATVSASYAQVPAYRRDLAGDIRPGERVFTRFTQEVSGDDERSARVRGASFESVRAWDGSEPAVVVASPAAARRGAN